MESDRLEWLNKIEVWLTTDKAQCGEDALEARKELLSDLKVLNYDWDLMLHAYGFCQ